MSKKIMMIEDDLVEVEIVKDLLLKEGYEFTYTEDGESGLKKVKDEKPDLIILDIMLPGKDGFYVCDVLKKDPNTENIPVIVLSSLDDPELESKGSEVGADHIIRKPFDEAKLKEKILELIR
jgi:DNA-binding response OmpR family regulator